jgi:hypothetical protein
MKRTHHGTSASPPARPSQPAPLCQRHRETALPGLTGRKPRASDAHRHRRRLLGLPATTPTRPFTSDRAKKRAEERNRRHHGDDEAGAQRPAPAAGGGGAGGGRGAGLLRERRAEAPGQAAAQSDPSEAAAAAEPGAGDSDLPELRKLQDLAAKPQVSSFSH